MSSPPDPVADLVGRGVRAELAAELVGSDLLVRVAGEPVVLAPDADPVTGSPRVLATPLGGPVPTPPLVDLVRERHPGAEAVVLVLPAGAPEPATGRAYMRYVLATDALAPADPEPGWVVRRADGHDAPDVVPLLVQAMADGYRGAGSPVATAALREHAERVFGQALAEGAVFVAHDGGGFAGHATVVPDEDELTGRPRLELFDTFVLPARRGSRASALLTSAVVRHARGLGLPLRGYVSGHDDNAARVLAKLTANGWRRDTTYWSLPLDEGRSAGG
ncbi:GNAT family N-acetyltransferase [Saccharothrix algeriensis]|uniref:GNAT superfamily N-acetyltransferase n=1 Tax=Saccharothrix algeriensis TaxID=173560 RepID=A0ABS2SFA8_9PSEU|nr:GNAT family N-acetyltransferase [Saccharothrix algeriensis]MBM7814480.1 GNAT superfamily N-acetyltransferase [Saccharothrix algeriensis]